MDDIDLLLELAKRYICSNDYGSAITAFLNILVLCPDNEVARRELSRLENIEYIHVGRGHSDAISRAVWVIDGIHVVSGGADNTIIVWDYKKSDIVRVFGDHRTCITTLTRHPKMPIIASGSEDGTIIIYDTYTCWKKILKEHTARINQISWSVEGKRLVSCSDDGKIVIWDPQTYEKKYVIGGDTGSIVGVRWSPSGRYLLSYSSGGIISVWNPRTGRLIYRLRDPSEGIFCADWSPGSEKIVCCSADGILRIYDIRTTRTYILGRHEYIASYVFWRRNNTIVSVGWDGKIILWDPVKLRQIMIIGKHSTPIICAALSKNKRYLATASLDRNICVWDLENLNIITTFRGHNHLISHLDWHPLKRLLLSASWDRRLIVWDTNQKSRESTLYYPSERITTLTWLDDDKYILIGYSNGDLVLFDIESTMIVCRSRIHDLRITSISKKRNSSLIATSSMDSTIAIVDYQDGFKTISRRPVFSLGVNSVSFHPRKDLILACSDDCTIKILDLNFEIVAEFRGHTTIVSDVCWSGDGSMFASSSWDGTVRIWTPDTETEYLLIKYDDKITCIDWNPRINYIAFGTMSGYVYVWNLKTINEYARIEAHRGPVSSIKWSNDGTFLASGGVDGAISIFHIIRKNIGERILRSPIVGISWHHTRKKLMACCNNGDIIIIEADIIS